MRCKLCSEPAVDVGPILLRELCGHGLHKRFLRELDGLRWCYQCLKGQVVAVVTREYRIWEKRIPRKPWGGQKG